MKALVIDAAPDVIEAIGVALQSAWPNTIVLPAYTGINGLDIVKREEPDIVILDLGLPDIDGYEVLSRIRRLSSVPVIILSVRDRAIDIAKGFSLGADDYITKPFSYIELIARFRNVLRLKGKILDESLPIHVTLPVELAIRTPISVIPIFHGRDFSTENDLICVLMPFSEEFKWIYQEHIRYVVEKKMRLRCMRSDDIFSTRAIVEDIWALINKAKVVIADLTGRNPNVYYEVGIAHTLGKDTILIAQDLDAVPFDLRSIRCYKYNPTTPGMKRLETQLKMVISEILKIKK